MADFRIKVEATDGSEMDERYSNGIECNGFVIMGDTRDRGITCLHEVSKLDIAKMIYASNELMESAKLAIMMEKFIRTIEKPTDDDFLERVINSLRPD